MAHKAARLGANLTACSPEWYTALIGEQPPPLEACIAGLACDAAAAANQWADHCIAPYERYVRQEAILRKRLDPLLKASGYAEALACAAYNLHDDHLLRGQENQANGVFSEVMCDPYRKCTDKTQDMAKLCDMAALHVESPCSPKDALWKGAVQTEERCKGKCEMDYEACNYYVFLPSQRHCTLTRRACGAGNASSATQNARSGACALVPAKANSSSSFLRSPRMVVAPPSRQSHNLRYPRRRGRPIFQMSCRDCISLQSMFGKPPFVVPRIQEATQAAQEALWKNLSSTQGKLDTWKSRYSAMWDLHPFGLWLGNYARRNGGATALVDAAVDFTMMDPHLTGIVHAISWATVLTLKDSLSGSDDNAGALMTSLIQKPDFADGENSTTKALKAVLDVWKQSGMNEGIQDKWSVHSAHGLGHGFTAVVGLRQALEVCHTIEPAMLRRFTRDDALGLPGEIERETRFTTLCAHGAWHTFVNSYTQTMLEELLGVTNIQNITSAFCSKLYPIPSNYSGPLVDTVCDMAAVGLDEAYARVVLVRAGGCQVAV